MERALLATLAIRVGEFVASDVLIDELWPVAQPATAARTLRSYVSRLRRRLQPDAGRRSRGGILERLPGGYRLVAAAVVVDTHEFERLVSDGERALAEADPRLASIRLRAALKLWRGPPFGDLRYQSFAEREAERLEERRAVAIELLAEADIALGHPATVVELLRQLVTSDPLRERAWRLLVESLHRAGRRAEALEAFENVRHVLAAELAVEPGDELQAVARAVRDNSLQPTVRRPLVNAIPTPLTPTIGRSRELRDLRGLIQRPGLVTLVGPAGSGKTRLAVELARQEQSDAGPGRVAWLELAAVIDASGLRRALGQALGVPESEAGPELAAFVAALSSEPPLLLLDNCEHLLDACGVVAAGLLEHCPSLTIVATSREPLGIPGERTLIVPPLPVPAAGATSVKAVSASPAVMLLVARAGEVRRGFAVTETNAPELGAIARRLDGLPLAIELAAVRLRGLAPGELLSRLTDRFGLLHGARSSHPAHHTLRAALDWSYELLSGPEQIVLRRLAVFPETFALAEAEAVCAAAPIGRQDVAGLVARLVDRSMVQAEDEFAMRYRLLETVREFATHELLRTESMAALRRRHRDVYLALIERVEPMLHGPRLETALRRLDAELPNATTALRWSLETAGEAGAGLRLATVLRWYWLKRGLFVEGLDWIDRALAAASDADDRERAAAEVGASWLEAAARPLDTAVVRRAEGAAHLASQAGDGRLEGWALVIAAIGWGRLGDFVSARRHAARALSLLAATDDLEGTASAHAALGMAAKYQAQFGEARRRFEQALAGYERVGDPWDAGWALINLADTAIRSGDAEEGAWRAREALSRLRGSWDGRSIATARTMLGQAALLGGDLRKAEEEFRVALRIAERRSMALLAAEARIGLAAVALERGDRATTVRLLDEVEVSCGDELLSAVADRLTKLRQHLAEVSEPVIDAGSARGPPPVTR